MAKLLVRAAVVAMLSGTAAIAATSPQSKACSTQADAKNLHGADREAFRTTCMKSAAPATGSVAAPAAPAAPATSKPAKPVAATTAAKPATVSPPTASGTTAAKSPQSAACSAQADAKGLHGADRETFRNGCMKGAAPAVAAAPAHAPVPAVAAAAPRPVPAPVAAAPPEPGSVAANTAAKAPAAKAPAGTRSPAQLAADERIHQCGQQWQAAKAANKIPAGQTWPQYWSACSARLKAA